MTYRHVFIAVVALSYLGFTLAGYEPSDGEVCFNAAFQDPNWMLCVEPVIQEVMADFNITTLCQSGEVEAMRCLFGKMNECFDILSLIGIPAEQMAFIDITSLSDAELVDVTCALYSEGCDEILKCDVNSDITDAEIPLIGGVQGIVGLCGPECIRNNEDTCPKLVQLFQEAAFDNFTDNFDAVRTQKTKMFVDENCRRASDFDVDCVINQLKSPRFQMCYNEASTNYPAPADTLSCPLYKASKACVENVITPKCGEASTDLLMETTLLSFPEVPSTSCLEGTSSAWQLEASTTMIAVAIAFLKSA